MTSPLGNKSSESPKAGRELDAEVAEKVFGYEIAALSWPCGFVPDGCEREVYEPTEQLRNESAADFEWRDEANESHKKAFLDEMHPVYWERHDNGYNARKLVPFFSTSIFDAWRVVERIQTLHPGWRFSVLGGDERWGYRTVRRKSITTDFKVDRTQRYTFGWHAEFFGDEDPTVDSGQRHGEAYADTPALAICRAALASLSSTPESPDVR